MFDTLKHFRRVSSVFFPLFKEHIPRSQFRIKGEKNLLRLTCPILINGCLNDFLKFAERQIISKVEVGQMVADEV